ncbi:MAG: choice-of-anchor J domain-containing protein, partial [Muribaculaceae bacterium]|nr:choice-of-anchor J domain-containing protein [Muribaculaceae bacterium]
AVFEGGALSGLINFTAPSTTFDGQVATGMLSYTVSTGDNVLAEGTTEFGAAVSAPVTLPASGEYVFTVTTANATGSSPAMQVKHFVGFGTPEATEATLVYENGTMKLSWEPVTKSADGGYLDPEAVVYTVTRFPGQVKVYEGSATEFSETVAEPDGLTKYYYTVVATADGVSGEAATSNTVSLGAGIVPPYLNTFDTAASIEGFTVIDSNNDARKWMWADNKGNGEVRMSWSGDKKMDDWLITPPVKLQGGKLYSVQFKAHASGVAYAERVEAKWGTDATVAAMTRDLVPPTDLTSADPMTVGNLIVPAADGLYYFGIHGISDPDKFYLYIDDFEVSAPRAATIPAAATGFKVTPAVNGDIKASVAFTTPTLDMAGNALSGLTKVELSRNGAVIKTWTAPATGAALSYDDEPEEGGNTTYSVVACNEDGAGAEASANVVIGIGRPAAPTGVKLTEEGNSGNVTLTWNAVTTTYEGVAIDPSRVTYDVCTQDYYGNWAPVEEGLTATTFSAQAVPEGRQDFVQYAVFAVTEGGETGAVSPMIAAGTPYEGMNESFANGELSDYIWGLGYNDGAEWDIYEDDYLEIPSSDQDNGYAAMRYSNDPGKGSLFTGKIALPEKSAGVSLHALVMTAGEEYNHNEIQLYVKEPADLTWTKLGQPFVMCEMGEPNTWAQCTASLQAYAGKVVQIRFEGITVDYTYTFMDQIIVGSLAEHDLAITGVSAPTEVACGNPYT